MVSKREIDRVVNIYQSTVASLDKVLVGQKNVKKAVAASILCDIGSKILMTGGPGTGKTTLSKFLSTSFESERISITSDIFPSDIQEQLKRNQNLQLLQIDEFNRASGKIQSVFLELFAEKQMSIGGEKYEFKDFYVFATQNSADIAGVFNVPQAVYDRFDMNIYFEKLSDEEKRILFFRGFKPETESHFELDELIETKLAVSHFETTPKDEDIMMRIFGMIDAMNLDGERLFAGSNIRAHTFALKLVKLIALSNGRDSIFPTDIIDFLNYIYIHRIDQNVASMNDKAVLDQFDAVKNKIVSMKR
ncbi:MAG: MoxR family ATPase [Bacilli bacterium]|nr:MoxR family ATPase [Bacilli bacterium]